MDGFDTNTPWSGMDLAVLLVGEKKKKIDKRTSTRPKAKLKTKKTKPRRIKEGYDTKVIQPRKDKVIETDSRFDQGLVYLYDQLQKFFHHELQHRVSEVVKCIILNASTRRRVNKNKVPAADLDPLSLTVYNRVRHDYAKPCVRKRIQRHMTNNQFSKRLINYFVINYPITVEPVCYFIDTSSYPVLLIGNINNSNQLSVTEEMRNNHNISYVNLHLAYKKHKGLHRHLHVPYGRSPYVTELCYDDVPHRTISEINFFMWFDSIAGFDVLQGMINVVKRCKFAFDKSVRSRKNVRCAHLKRMRTNSSLSSPESLKTRKKTKSTAERSLTPTTEQCGSGNYKRYRDTESVTASKNYTPYIIEHTWKPQPMIIKGSILRSETTKTSSV